MKQKETNALTPEASQAWLSAWIGRWGSVSLCLIFAPLFFLILKDRRVWPWDEAFYGEFSVMLFRTISRSPLDWPSAMVHALGDRPPAIAWIGQFFVPLAPAMPLLQSALLLFTLGTQLASILLLYHALSKVYAQRFPALLTSFVVATGPLFVALTYRYFVEPLQAFSVVWVLVLASYHDRLSRKLLLVHMAAAIAFGLLAKVSSPLYQLPILLYLVHVCIRRSSGPPARASAWNSRTHLYVASAGAILIVLGTAAWYYINFDATIQHVVEASSGSLSAFFGTKGSISTKLAYWVTQFQQSFFWFPILFFGLLMIFRASFVRRRQDSDLTQADLFGLVSTIWIFVFLLLFSSNINEDSRYLLGLFPYVACAVCWLLVHIKSLAALLAFGALSLMQFAIVTAQAYGVIEPRQQLSVYLHPYVPDDRALRDVMLCVANTSDATIEQGIFVGEETPEFNGGALSFYRTILGHAKPTYGSLQIFSQINAEAQWSLVREGPFQYYVFRLDPYVDSDQFNRLATPLFEKVYAAPEFQLRTEKSNQRMLIFERR